jgi:hypothetical protein
MHHAQLVNVLEALGRLTHQFTRIRRLERT